MDTKKKIVVIGSSNTDMVIKSDRLPKPGETILGGNFLMNHGGKGANQAVAAARLGGDVTFICKIGNDIFGNETLEMFHKEKIDTTYVGITPQEPSGVALINVDKKGENCIVVASLVAWWNDNPVTQKALQNIEDIKQLRIDDEQRKQAVKEG